MPFATYRLRRLGFRCTLVLAAFAFASPLLAQRSSRSSSSEDERQLVLERQLVQETTKVEARYLKSLERIVVWATANGLKDDARALIDRMKSIQPEYPELADLEKKLSEAEAAPADDVERLRRSLQSRLDSANGSHASRLYKLAEACMKYGLFSHSYQLVNEVLDVDPDHRQARRVLQYTFDSRSKTWLTNWEAKMRRTHFVTDEGWVAKRDKSKWDKGLREYKGQWITQEEEKRIRERNPLAPYFVETEHFRVETNLGREKAFEFAQRLEDFYDHFFEFFVGFWDQVAGARLLFNIPDDSNKHVVQVFPSRVKYLDFVRMEKGNNELLVRSGGFWSSGDRKSFFFWTDDPKETDNVLYHETTHQLLGETKKRSGYSQGNIWVVEGVAHYMELWEKVNGRWRPGYRIDAPSMKAIRQFLASNSSWSLASYVRLNHEQFHEKSNRTFNYFMGGALSHFLLHYQGGIYREDYIQLLRAYYEGEMKEDSLPEYIHVEGASTPQETLATLEKQFREYMRDLKRPGEITEEDLREAAAEAETASG